MSFESLRVQLAFRYLHSVFEFDIGYINIFVFSEMEYFAKTAESVEIG